MVVNPRRDAPDSAGTLSVISWWPGKRPTMQPAGLQQNPLSLRVAASEMSVVRECRTQKKEKNIACIYIFHMLIADIL